MQNNLKKQKTYSTKEEQLIINNIDYTKYFLPLIIVVTAIIYFNSLSNEFITNLDDGNFIINNEIIKSLNWTNIKEIFSFSSGSINPLTLLTFAIEYKFFGLNPFSYHLINLVLHLSNVILVFYFIKQFSGKVWVAAITTIFFAVHPMQVEAVAWVVERKTLLYTLFFLLSLISYSKYLLNINKKSYLICSFIWFFLSLMSKPTAISLPLVILLIDFYFYKKISIKLIISKIPYFILSLIFGLIAVFLHKSGVSFNSMSQSYNFIDRIFLLSYSFVFYLFKIFFPISLSVMHLFPIKANEFLPFEYYLSLPAILLIGLGVYKSKILKKEIIFGMVFYLFSIVIFLQFLPIGNAIVSERYSYVPFIGIFFIFGHLYSFIIEKSEYIKTRKIFSYIIVILFAIYCTVSFDRVKVWKNGVVLFTDVINKNQNEGLAWAYRGRGKYDKGDIDGALNDFNIAIKLKPNVSDWYFVRGIAKNDKGDIEGAFNDFNSAIKLNSKDPEYFFNRGNEHYYSKNYESAIKDYNYAIILKPNYAEAFSNRGGCFGVINLFEESLKDYNQAISLNPKYADAYFGRGMAKYS